MIVQGHRANGKPHEAKKKKSFFNARDNSKNRFIHRSLIFMHTVFMMFYKGHGLHGLFMQ